MVLRNFEQENGRPAPSQTKLKAPVVLGILAVSRRPSPRRYAESAAH